ncbi:two component transcriptional regulator, winged helix family [Burkholderia sp. CF099]|nr:two component transcriptional regulator, winged helix family [Burkholderia sp. CF099]
MRILLAEDNAKLAESVLRVLREAGFAVDHMEDGTAADLVLRTQDYAAVILDIGLPKIDGLEVLKRLRERHNPVPVLVLTAHDAVSDRVRGLNLGADDYLAKPCDLSELEARVRALIRRSQGIDQSRVVIGSLVYDSVSRVFTLADAILGLTPREHAILEILVLRAGKAVSKEALAEKISGLDALVSPDAIEIYVSRLRKKLENADVSVVTLRGLGYLLKAGN